MKKIFCAVLFLFAAFASSACAEYVAFPTVGVEMDIPKGWTHSYNGAGYVAVVAPDGKSAMTLQVFDMGGRTLEDWASDAAKQQKATDLKPSEHGFTFTFSANGITNTTVVYQISDTTAAMLGRAGDAPEIDGIIDSMQDLDTDSAATQPQSTQTVKFPNVKITLDVESGWTYEDIEGGGIGIFAPGKRSSMSVTRFNPQGMPLEQVAKELSKAHKGTEPAVNSGIYYYYFNDNKTTVYVTPSDTGKEIVVISMTPATQEDLEAMQRMLSSSKDI